MSLDSQEKTLIDYATEGNYAEAERILKEKKEAVDVQDEHGMTPLQHAAFKGHTNICSLLLSHGADVNNHDHDQGYTALMFAALSGNGDVVRLLLEAGAKTYQTNRIGRTAAQLAAFTGQKQCVDAINNYVTLDDLKYYTIPQGQETEGKLPESCVNGFQSLLISTNFNPIHLYNRMRQHPALIESMSNVKRMSNTLALIIERSLSPHHTNEPNDILAIKAHYIKTLIDLIIEKKNDDLNKVIGDICKKLAQGTESNGFRMYEEKFVRETIRDFPYKQCPLLQQLVRLIAPIPLGNYPTALTVFTNTINGRTFEDDASNRCETCNEPNAARRCTACKSVFYCNEQCQRLRWPTHKRFCASSSKSSNE